MSVQPERILYFVTYPPSPQQIEHVRSNFDKDLNAIYGNYIEKAKQMCIEEGITCIPLDHWTNKEKIESPGSGPDPTPHGAQLLASYI